MKTAFKLVCGIAAMLLAASAHAALTIFACEPEWAALAAELGGDKVQVYSATTAKQDPHRIEPRPSLIAKLRRADLMVCTGADLEAGWAPMLLRQAANPKVRPGQPGYFEAAAQVQRLDVPARVDRAAGDVHAGGNPHVHTDPRRIAVIAERLAERLAQLDAANATHYRARHADFAARWTKALATWQARAASLRGVRVVAHHKDWVYLYDWLGLVAAGTLEPKPGVPPSAAHLAALKAELARAPARAIVRTPYQDPRPGEWLAQQTGTPLVVLPYTVGGSARATDLFGLVDDTLDRLLGAQR
ncbi:MAG: metal ABC transporter substrate-binding protein [Gammaproteobacteria bacterium]